MPIGAQTALLRYFVAICGKPLHRMCAIVAVRMR